MSLNHFSTKVILVFAVASVCCAQTNQPPAPPAQTNVDLMKTGPFFNGRLWKILTDEGKRAFVLGLGNALDFFALAVTQNFADYRKASSKMWPTSLTYDEVVASLNKFYETPENSPVSIIDAVRFSALRAAGTDEATIQKDVLETRARAQK